MRRGSSAGKRLANKDRHPIHFLKRASAMSKRAPTVSGEERLIARHFAPLAKDPGAFGLSDDAAVITPPKDCDLVLKTDGIVGGVHFFADDPADAVARKALRVNLSDLAAKGARPLGFLLTLALPQDIDDDWLAAFARGLGEDAEAYGCPLFGGDTDRTPGPVTISIAVFGAVPRGKMVRRSGARAGQRVLVSGTIGDAALGLMLRRDPARSARWRLDDRLRDHLTGRYLVPEPRNALAEAVLAHAAGAMDVSDGLVGDLAKMCRASGVAAEIEVARVPLSAAARAALAAEPTLIDTILTGGDDYEVLATLPPDKTETFRLAAAAAGVAVTDIGRIVPGGGETEIGDARFLGPDGKPLAFARASYSHF
jgi:thiamine-monophosphate kinase